MRIRLHTLVAALRGGTDRRAVALTIFFSLLAGFLTGPNVALPLLLAVALLLNLPARLFAVGWAVAAGAAWLLAPVTWHLGHLLLDETPLGGLLAQFAPPWLLVLLELDRYTTMGNLLAGSALASAAARGAYLAMGHLAARRGHEVQRGRLWRPAGVPLAIALAALTAVGTWALGPWFVAGRLLTELSRSNGAEVTAEGFELSPWDGTFALRDVRLADPAQLDRDRAQIAVASGRLSITALLRGYLHFDDLQLDGVRHDVPRHAPARPFGRHIPRIEAVLAQPATLEPSDAILLREHLRNGSVVQARLEWLQALLAHVEDLSEKETATAGRRAARAERSDLGHPAPRIAVATLRVEGLPYRSGFASKTLLEMQHVSSQPALLARPTTVRLVAPELGTEIEATLHLADDSPRHQVALKSFDVPLSSMFDGGRCGPHFLTRGGTLTLHGQGWFDRQRIAVSLDVDARDLDVQVVGADAVAGLQPATWNEGLRRLTELRANLSLAGSWSDLRLLVHEEQLVSQFKHQLRAARQHNLVRAIEAELAHSAETRPTVADRPAAGEAAAVDEPEGAPADRTDAANEVATQPPTEVRSAEPRYADLESAWPVTAQVAASTEERPIEAESDDKHPASRHGKQRAERLYDRMVQGEQASEAGSDVCEGCTTLPTDDPGTVVGYPVTTPAPQEYPSTSTPHFQPAAAEPSFAWSAPATGSLPASAVAPTSAQSPPWPEPTLPRPVNMETGYDHQGLPDTAASLRELAARDAAAAAYEAEQDERGEGPLSRWTRTLANRLKEAWPFKRSGGESFPDDPWSDPRTSPAPSTTAPLPAGIAAAPPASPPAPPQFDAFYADEADESAEPVLEAQRESPLSRLQFWRR